MSKVTFVMTYIHSNVNQFEGRDMEWRFQKFLDVAKTGINICLYLSHHCIDNYAKYLKDFDNVKLMKIVKIEDTIVSRVYDKYEYSSPVYQHINKEKDTDFYMKINLSKAEYLKHAIDENPWGSTHFAMMDFNISHIFKDMDKSLEKLKLISTTTFPEKIFLIPGFWNPTLENQIEEYLLNIPCWRFCGGFYLADKESMLEYWNIYYSNFEGFVAKYKRIFWEVNYMSWLETTTDWKVTWYQANHDDSMLKIPYKCYIKCFDEESEKCEYDYPLIDGYLPSSASYLYHNGRHLLNTRFVNYSLTEKGSYLINDPSNTLFSKNIYSELDDQLIPTEYYEMDDSTVGLTSIDSYSHGLEDMRLYSLGDKVRFIATNVNYSETRRNRMVAGDYNNDFTYSNCAVLEPPVFTWCEKNWVPIAVKNDAGDLEERFIYKWYPMEIGKMNLETNTLEIVKSYDIESPHFRRVRGSTIFIDNGDDLLGVVHYSEETAPRQYYHMLVTLDKETLAPKKQSAPFCFQHYGIEFCIGFTIKDGKYVFWVSKKDNNAMRVSIDVDNIQVNYDII